MCRTLIAFAMVGVMQFMPALAQGWRLQPRVQREIQEDIGQLDALISHASARRIISRKEAGTLRRNAASLRRSFNRYARDGLDQREVADLERQVNRLRTHMHLDPRRWDSALR